jgi:hypothetical protein
MSETAFSRPKPDVPLYGQLRPLPAEEQKRPLVMFGLHARSARPEYSADTKHHLSFAVEGISGTVLLTFLIRAGIVDPHDLTCGLLQL